MPKLISTACLLLFVCLSVQTSAQKNKTFIGGNLMYGFPSGTFGDAYKHASGIEGLLGFGHDKVYFIGSLGYQSYKAESSNIYGKVTVIPVKAGIRIYPTNLLFLTGNAGVGFLKDEVMSSRESRFMFDAGIGVHLVLVQISLHYEAWKRQNTDGFSPTVMLKAGFALK